MERTFVLIKPEGVMRGLIGEVISRFERKGLNVIALKILNISSRQAEDLYSVHRTKDFYKRLLEHIMSGPVVAMVIEGPNAVKAVRRLVGATNPQEADPGSIRAEFALNITQNIVHAADSLENASNEIKIFFEDNEILNYKKPTETQFLF
ncbi:nucleoside-diphosphate kinase [Candidatus Bathyarchaeota archaeon]|nr:nucleoside-diphosphate kinase [Candidatus Bathyarchaeota archaeon]